MKEFREKKVDEASYYGLNRGHSTQYQKAIKRRAQENEELRALSKMVSGRIILTDDVDIYAYYCPTCKEKIMLNTDFGESVICPICERKISRASYKETMEVVRGSRTAAVRDTIILLNSDGTYMEEQEVKSNEI